MKLPLPTGDLPSSRQLPVSVWQWTDGGCRVRNTYLGLRPDRSFSASDTCRRHYSPTALRMDIFAGDAALLAPREFFL